MKTPIDELEKYWKEKQEEKDIEVVEYLRDLGDKLEIVQGMATIKEKEAKLAHKKYHDDKDWKEFRCRWLYFGVPAQTAE